MLATVGFAALGSQFGSPSLGDLFWFVVRASAGFTAVEAAASRGFVMSCAVTAATSSSSADARARGPRSAAPTPTWHIA